MAPIITSDPEIMHGTSCFAGTRVPVQNFFDHIEADYSVTGFLEQFPTVRRDQVMALIAQLREETAHVVVTTR